MSKYYDRRQGFKEGQDRPEFVTDDHLKFLDGLRESGATNMYGARPYLQEEFPDLEDGDASAVLGYWMKTFGDPRR